MPRLGDNISPVKYVNQTPRALTRFELHQELYRAFIAMGMTPVHAYGRQLRHVPVDIMDPATDIMALNLDTHVSFEMVSVFDYPDSYTFEAAGETLRPCLVMVMGWENVTTLSDQGHCWGIHHMARLDVADPNTAIFDATGNVGTLLRGILQTNGSTTNMYFGGSSDVSLSWFFWDAPGLFSSTSYWGNSEHWKAHPSDDYYEDAAVTSSHSQLMPVGNVQIILSDGGFLLQIGSGTKKTQVNDYINFLVVFGGERFPGRGVPEAEDIERLHTNSSYELTLNDGAETGDTFYSNSTANRRAPNGILIGGRFENRITGGVQEEAASIKCRTLNFDNADYVFQDAKYFMGSHDSPRAIDGTGYHVLSPWVYVLHHQSTSGASYSPGSASSATTGWKWRDVYYAPGLVFGDTIAPAGEYVDQNTNKTYHMFYTQRFGEMFGIDVTGATQLTPASIPALMPTHTLIDETVYTMVSGSIVIDSGVVPVSAGAKDSSWTMGAGGLDELQNLNWTNANEHIQYLHFDTSGDPDDYAYELLWDCTNYGDASTGPGNGTLHPRMNNSIMVNCRNGESGGQHAGTTFWPTVFGGIPNAGADTPPAKTISSWLRRHVTSKWLDMTFNSDYTHGTASKQVTISNIRLRRWQLQ